ncbi:hypothetical protein [Vogesella oryzae]|uniref:hypothetical protein n=1 Tax=Vogesella oryzae TaxID=1735285 RepID=UPI00158176B8|nr:hypothetical protein [Vogesella oryzae]
MSHPTLRHSLFALCASLLAASAIAAQPLPPNAAPGACPPPHAEGRMHAEPGSLEPLLPQLQLSARQEMLWQQAETARLARMVAQRRAAQQAQAALRANLSNPKVPLSVALRDAQPAAKDAPFTGSEWASFFDSLSAQQASLVRQYLLAQSGDNMPPASPGMPREGEQPRP